VLTISCDLGVAALSMKSTRRGRPSTIHRHCCVLCYKEWRSDFNDSPEHQVLRFDPRSQTFAPLSVYRRFCIPMASRSRTTTKPVCEMPGIVKMRPCRAARVASRSRPRNTLGRRRRAGTAERQPDRGRRTASGRRASWPSSSRRRKPVTRRACSRITRSHGPSDDRCYPRNAFYFKLPTSRSPTQATKSWT